MRMTSSRFPLLLRHTWFNKHLNHVKGEQCYVKRGRPLLQLISWKKNKRRKMTQCFTRSVNDAGFFVCSKNDLCIWTKYLRSCIITRL